MAARRPGVGGVEVAVGQAVESHGRAAGGHHAGKDADQLEPGKALGFQAPGQGGAEQSERQSEQRVAEADHFQQQTEALPHATGPRGAFTINGSQSYENLYTLNGAVINENLRGAPMTPYIEDAIQEVTVASAGISAEYGRFAGGVANAVTKSGGNHFSGSFRTSFANDSWRSYTPFESTQLIANPSAQLKLDKTVPTYEATCAAHRAIDGRALSKQTWFLFPKLREVDTLLQTRPEWRAVLHEGHPEVSFATWNGGTPMAHPKKTREGAIERQHVLDACWPGLLDQARASLPRGGWVDDDLRDACAVLWTARRVAAVPGLETPRL